MTNVSSSPPSANAPASGLAFSLVALLGILTAFGPMAIDMYLPSLPAMSADLGSNMADAQLTVASFLAGLAAGQLIYGPLSDRMGRRPPLMVGVILYTIASVGCVFATSMDSLIVLRFVQAVGGAAAPLIARAVISDRCSGIEAARAFSLLMLVMGASPILAPTLGGLILMVGGWRTIFWVLTAFGLVALVWAFIALPETFPAEKRNSRPKESMLKAFGQVLSNREILRFAMLASLGSACLFTYISNAANVMIGTYGIDPTFFGYVFGLNACAIVGSAQINRMLLNRHTPLKIVQAANMALLVLAALMLIGAVTDYAGKFGVLVPMFFIMACIGLTNSNATAMAMDVDRGRAGTVSSFVGFMHFAMGALFASVTGALADGTARPMAGAILLAAILGAVTLRLIHRARRLKAATV
ncbi:MAG TPA: multidrug effflux MFS transporter [Pedomonas sp.]|uniref:multidrug effflux MFS transporter n=1 Tax=Pedomonas sp. TaxID=2976421 RepID=UPI002F42DD3C